MNANRRFNSIARRISRSWRWKRLWLTLSLNALALATVLAQGVSVTVCALAVARLRQLHHAAEDLREIDKDQCVCHRVVVIEKAADQRLIGSPVDLDRHRIRDIVLDLICRIQT